MLVHMQQFKGSEVASFLSRIYPSLLLDIHGFFGTGSQDFPPWPPVSSWWGWSLPGTLSLFSSLYVPCPVSSFLFTQPPTCLSFVCSIHFIYGWGVSNQGVSKVWKKGRRESVSHCTSKGQCPFTATGDLTLDYIPHVAFPYWNSRYFPYPVFHSVTHAPSFDGGVGCFGDWWKQKIIQLHPLPSSEVLGPCSLFFHLSYEKYPSHVQPTTHSYVGVEGKGRCSLSLKSLLEHNQCTLVHLMGTKAGGPCSFPH